MFARLMSLVLFTAVSLSCVACCTDTPVEGAEKQLAIEYASLAESQITIACTEAKWWKNTYATQLCTSQDINHPPANCKSRVRYRFLNYTGSWLDSISDVMDPPYLDKEADPPAVKLRVPDFCDTTSSEAYVQLGCWIYFAQELGNETPTTYKLLTSDVGQRIKVTHPKYTMSVETKALPGVESSNPLGSWDLRPDKNLVCKRWGELRKALGIPSATK